MTETFYDVLGVAEDATTDEIESAYRERLKETHPDVSDDEDAGAATRRLVEARDVLVDDDERARYDRLGHAVYLGEVPVTESTTPADAAAKTTGTASGDTDRGPTGTSERGGARDRAARERRASQRVEQEQRRSASTGTASGTRQTSETASATANDSSAATSRRRPGQHVRADATGEPATQYSVRQDVSTPTSFGPILPTGHRLTLLGIFFALYPVLLFSTLLPAFPLVVNLVVGFCLLLTVAYLQSMPRVGLIVFGTWSALAVVVLVLSGIGLLSLVGVAVLSGTVLPFALSVLTASALRF